MSLVSFLPFLFLDGMLSIMEREMYLSQNYSNILKHNNAYVERQS